MLLRLVDDLHGVGHPDGRLESIRASAPHAISAGTMTGSLQQNGRGERRPEWVAGQLIEEADEQRGRILVESRPGPVREVTDADEKVQ